MLTKSPGIGLAHLTWRDEISQPACGVASMMLEPVVLEKLIARPVLLPEFFTPSGMFSIIKHSTLRHELERTDLFSLRHIERLRLTIKDDVADWKIAQWV